MQQESTELRNKLEGLLYQKERILDSVRPKPPFWAGINFSSISLAVIITFFLSIISSPFPEITVLHISSLVALITLAYIYATLRKMKRCIYLLTTHRILLIEQEWRGVLIVRDFFLNPRLIKASLKHRGGTMSLIIDKHHGKEMLNGLKFLKQGE